MGLFFAFATSSLQAVQKFLEWGGVNVFSNATRLILIYILFFVGALTINSAMTAYTVIPFFAFIASFLFLPNFLKVRGEKQVVKEFFHYNNALKYICISL